jgi:hypothetical protein
MLAASFRQTIPPTVVRTVTTWLSVALLVPVTVTPYGTPDGLAVTPETVRSDVPEVTVELRTMLKTVNDDVEPVGAAVLRVIVPVKPFRLFTVIVDVVERSTYVVTLAGLADIE